jgi:hypothetical protein
MDATTKRMKKARRTGDLVIAIGLTSAIRLPGVKTVQGSRLSALGALR